VRGRQKVASFNLPVYLVRLMHKTTKNQKVKKSLFVAEALCAKLGVSLAEVNVKNVEAFPE